jgi:hypothetical protein
MMILALNALPVAPAGERFQIYLTFKSLAAQLAEDHLVDKETEQKVETLLWFCERISRPDYASLEIKPYSMDWPLTIIDAIKQKYNGQDFFSAQ